MLWGTYLVLTVTVLYMIAAFAYAYQHQFGSALMFFSYCLANVGFLYQTGMYVK